MNITKDMKLQTVISNCEAVSKIDSICIKSLIDKFLNEAKSVK